MMFEIAMVLLTLFAFSIASAFIPIFNLELAMIAAVAAGPPLLVLALVAAVGQMIGKLIFYLIGSGKIQSTWLQSKLKRKETKAPSQKIKQWQEYMDKHPRRVGSFTFFSGLTGLPPFAIISVMAGALRVNIWLFIITGLAGRFGRFAVIALVPGLASYLH